MSCGNYSQTDQMAQYYLPSVKLHILLTSRFVLHYQLLRKIMIILAFIYTLGKFDLYLMFIAINNSLYLYYIVYKLYIVSIIILLCKVKKYWNHKYFKRLLKQHDRNKQILRWYTSSLRFALTVIHTRSYNEVHKEYHSHKWEL